MAIRKTVRRGDSLWALSNRYLGSGTRYPQIVDYHNQEAARHGLRRIDKPDLIFVGETILIPPRPKSPKPDNSPKAKGTKTGGGQPSTPVNAKVTFVIGRDTPPIVYTTFSGDYTIKTEMSGGIDIEIASPDRYRHSLELLFSKNTVEARQKLYDAYDPAIVALTAKPEMVFDFESGKIKIEAPIAAEANLGPYTVRVDKIAPMHMAGILKPPIVNGTLEIGRRKYKYSADIEFRVDVIWHQRPKTAPEPVTGTVKENVTYTDKKDAYERTGHTTKWDQTVAEKGAIVAVVLVIFSAAGLILNRITTRGGLLPTPIMQPFTHTINRDNPRA